MINDDTQTQGDAALSLLSVAHPRITRDIRFGARLAPHPNFAPFHFAKLRISLTLCAMRADLKKIGRSFSYMDTTNLFSLFQNKIRKFLLSNTALNCFQNISIRLVLFHPNNLRQKLEDLHHLSKPFQH